MKAIYLERQGSQLLTLGDIPQPQPKPGEVLVKIQATAVTPTELQWYPTWHTPSGGPRPYPIVLGHEFSGTVESADPEAGPFKIGDAVYGLNDWFSNGAQAEYCTAPATALARKPISVGQVQAAAVPISALTAWQGLFEKARLKRGERVLIHGAAGGVGVFAVQLAHGIGAEVIATASAGNLDFIRSLGADMAIDYHARRFEDLAKNIDVVFDAVGGETLQRSWGVLAKGGRLVTVATQSESTADSRAREAFMLVRADGRQLAEIAERIDAGRLKIFVAGIYPLEHASEAFARAREGKMRGKAVLRMAG